MEQLNAQNDAVLKEAAIVAILKAYAKFLLAKGLDPKAIGDKINQVVSCALDKGDVTQNTVAMVNEKIAAHAEIGEDELEAKLTEKFVEHALGCTVPKVIASMGLASDPAFACFSKVVAAREAFKAAVGEVVSAYGEAIRNHAKIFFQANANLFEPDFAKFFE